MFWGVRAMLRFESWSELLLVLVLILRRGCTEKTCFLSRHVQQYRRSRMVLDRLVKDY